MAAPQQTLHPPLPSFFDPQNSQQSDHDSRKTPPLDYTPEGRMTNFSRPCQSDANDDQNDVDDDAWTWEDYAQQKPGKRTPEGIPRVYAMEPAEATRIKEMTNPISHEKYQLPPQPEGRLTYDRIWNIAIEGDLPAGQAFKLCAVQEAEQPKYDLERNAERLDGQYVRRQRFRWKLAKWCAENYKKQTDKKRITQESTDGTKLRFIKYTHMLTNDYIIGLLSKFHRSLRTGQGVTLTLRNAPESSIAEDRERITKCFKDFAARVRRYADKLGRERPEYFWICEIGGPSRTTKNGYTTVGFNVHMHVLFFNCPLLSKTWCKNAWKEITGDSYQVETSKKSQRAKRYVEKYLTKALKGDLTPTLVLNWACQKRVWGKSKNAFDLPRVEAVSGSTWFTLGVCHTLYLGVWHIEYDDDDDELQNDAPPPMTDDEFLEIVGDHDIDGLFN